MQAHCRFWTFILALLLVNVPSFAQESDEPVEVEVVQGPAHKVTISSRVKGKGSVIKRAEVRIGDQVLYTDRDGKLELSIPPGKGKIVVLRFGYDKEFVNFETLREGSEYDVFLYPATPGDNEVYIRGEKRPSTSKKTISGVESAKVAPGGDPAQVTQLLPGVQTQAFDQDVAVRGSGPQESRYYIDNWEVFSIFHQIGNISVLPPRLISDVEFYAGGFGPEYGDATGGVIVLRTKSEIPEEPLTEFLINIPFFSGIYHERPLSESSSLIASARYSYLQYILPEVLPDDVNATVVPYFSDAHVMYNTKDDNGGHTKYFLFGAQDGIELIFDYDESSNSDGRGSIDFYRGFATFGIERLQPLGSGWSYTASPQIIYDTADQRFFDDYVKWDIYSARMWFELSKKFSKNEFLYIGFEPRYGEFHPNIRAPVPSDDPLFDFEEAPREEETDVIYFADTAAWVSIDRQFGPFILTPGVRYLYDYYLEDSVVDPRLLGRVMLSDSHTLKGAVGQYSSTPDGQKTNEEFGNTELTFARSMHYVLGLESRWSDRWETDLQLYYKRTHNVVFEDPETRYNDDGTTRSKGVEVFVRRNLTDRAFGWVSYTYSQTDERENDEADWQRAEYDQTHVATLAASYRIFAGWELGTRMSYNTGDTYTPIDDAVYNANLDKYQPRAGEENSERLPDFHRIDIFNTNDALFDTWKMSFRWGVQYLAFNRPVFGKDYNYDYSKERDINTIPPIPFIEVRGEL